MQGTLYVITNKINGKQYIGKTYSTIEERFKQHILDSKKEKNKDRDLYKAFNFFGVENFAILELGKFDENILEEKEIEYIAKYDTYKNGYNQTLGGDGKRYITTSNDEFIRLYHELGTVTKVAKHTKHDVGWISTILKNSGVQVHQAGYKPININELKISFENQHECAKWLVENNHTKAKSLSSIKTNIWRVLNGKRKSYCGFTFSLVNHV